MGLFCIIRVLSMTLGSSRSASVVINVGGGQLCEKGKKIHAHLASIRIPFSFTHLFPGTNTAYAQPNSQPAPDVLTEIGSMPYENDGNSKFYNERAKIEYHLSHVFPAQRVRDVMNAHPNVNDGRYLCQCLLDMGINNK
jgi:hypothetical protein